MTPQRIMLLIMTGLFLLISGWYIAKCPGVAVCPFFRKEKDPPGKVKMTFVGPWDSPHDWDELLKAFNEYKKKENNGYLDVSITYEQISDSINYEDVVKQRQFDDKGPNIFMIYHKWIPRYEGRVLPAPKSIMTFSEFDNTYAKAAVEDLTGENGTIYALPFYIDTLALYYNSRMFMNEGIAGPPKNWIEFENYVEKLTYYKKENGRIVYDANGSPVIEFAGAAFGGGSNVNRSQDIIVLLIMQNNYDEPNPVSFSTDAAGSAVKYYIDFTDPNSRFYTWNKDQMFSIDAFTQRKAAMMINYGKEIPNIKSKTGGTMDYKIAPLPQLDERRKLNYASYWVPVVASKAPCIAAAGVKVNCYDLAWEFLDFASKEKNVKKYLDKTNRAAANLKIAEEQSLAGDARSVFASQVFTARSWRNAYDSIADEKILDMINYLIANKDNRKDIVKALANLRRYTTEIKK